MGGMMTALKLSDPVHVDIDLLTRVVDNHDYKFFNKVPGKPEVQGVRPGIGAKGWTPPLSVRKYQQMVSQKARGKAATCTLKLAMKIVDALGIAPPDFILDDIGAAGAKAQRRALPESERELEERARAIDETIDTPGRAREGGSDIRDIVQFAAAAGRPLSLKARALILQGRLAAANHAADRPAAEEAWVEFQALEPRLMASPDLIDIAAGLHNRRAVTLTDCFRFGEAAAAARVAIGLRERVRDAYAVTYRLDREAVRVAELAELHGTLGQACAFASDLGAAEAAFRRAAALFGSRNDQRQWVYLGHLACERERGAAGTGRSLWIEVLDHLPALASPKPVLRPGDQFLLALQLKGVYCFGTDDAVTDMVGMLQMSAIREAYEGAVEAHPFGLIFQTIGMLHLRARPPRLKDLRPRTSSDGRGTAPDEHWFDLADQAMRTDSPLVRLLAAVARIRRALPRVVMEQDEAAAWAEREPKSNPYTWSPWPQRLVDALNSAQQTVAERFAGDEATKVLGLDRDITRGTAVARAKGVLDGIRFNWW